MREARRQPVQAKVLRQLLAAKTEEEKQAINKLTLCIKYMH